MGGILTGKSLSRKFLAPLSVSDNDSCNGETPLTGDQRVRPSLTASKHYKTEILSQPKAPNQISNAYKWNGNEEPRWLQRSFQSYMQYTKKS